MTSILSVRGPLISGYAFVPYCVLCIAAGLLYWNGLSGPFLFDDHANIVNNPAVQIDALSVDTLRSSLEGPEAGPLGRPISVLSFALNHAMFGLDPFFFKVINLAIHLANGALLLGLLTLLVRHSRFSASAIHLRPAIVVVVAIWVLHPINVLPILMSVQRMTLLAAFFTLIALTCHFRGFVETGSGARKAGWLIGGWMVAWPMAVLSKETAILFPLYAVISSWVAVDPRGRRDALRLTLLGLIAALVVAVGFLTFSGLDWLASGYASRPFTMAERLMTEARVLWYYAGQILIPSYARFGLYLDGIPVSISLSNPVTTWVAIAAWLAAALVLAVLLRSHKLVALSILWFLAGHSVESTILPLEIAHEHRNYLPSIGLIVAAALGLRLLAEQIGVASVRRTLVLGVAFVALVFASFYTWMRATQYSDEVNGYLAEVFYHPRSARANYVAATTLVKHHYGAVGDPTGEILVQYHLEEAGRVNPAFKDGYVALLIWACSSGRPVNPDWVDQLAHRLEYTRFGPSEREFPQDLFVQLSSLDGCVERSQAVSLFSAGGRNETLVPVLRANFLEMASDYELVAYGDTGSAIRFLKQAIALDRSRPEARDKLDSLERLHQMQQDAINGHARDSQ